MPRSFTHALVGNRDLGLDHPRRMRRAQTSYPMTLSVEPIAVSRGQTAMITITGRENFSGAWKLLCEGPGLRGEVQNVEKAEPKMKARGGAGDAEPPRSKPGSKLPRTHRLARTSCGWPHPRASRASGSSSLSTDPVVTETSHPRLANDRPGSAPKLALPAVVSGRSQQGRGCRLVLPSSWRKASASALRSGATVSKTRSTTSRNTSTRS